MTTKKNAVPAKKAVAAKNIHPPAAVTPAPIAARTPAVVPPTKSGAAGQPVFNQPAPSPDPTSFSKSVTDKKLKGIVKLEAFPPSGPDPAVLIEPVLTLAQVYGAAGPPKEAAIVKAGQIVFHCVGDTGSVIGPQSQNRVADKMLTDFDEDNAADLPSFFFHLGDVVYYFGEATYYYDQFYEPYRDYPAPIIAIAGNHDGVVYPNDTAQSLDAFIANFCTPTPSHSPDAGGLNRTTMIQPAVYFTFEAPLVRIFGLYSNVLEDPGVISSQKGTSSSNTVLDDRQLAFLTAGLKRVASEGFKGAVVIAMHHPPFTGGSEHGGSPIMLAEIDACCTTAGVWPHAVFSGHAHNYQRYTRTINGKQVPFIVAGCGGHNPLSPMRATLRTPYVISDTLTLNNVDATDFGYTRVIVNATTMIIEQHPESDGGTTKTPNDMVTINLANYTVS